MNLHEAQACVVPPELGLALLRWTAKKYRPKVAQSTARALVGDDAEISIGPLSPDAADGHCKNQMLIPEATLMLMLMCSSSSVNTRRCYVCKYHVTVHLIVSI